MNGTIAIITARGGSKRIPYKNIKEFCGKPIIEYSIQAAKESGIFDEIMVSTNDKKIAALAKIRRYVRHWLMDLIEKPISQAIIN